MDGIDVVTPKSVAKEFVEAGYCEYKTYELFIQAINDRNQLSHIYRQEMAETIRQRLPEYVHMVERIVSVMHENLEDLKNGWKKNAGSV